MRERTGAAGLDRAEAAAAGLAAAAGALAEHVAGRRVATEDPGALVGLLAFADGPVRDLAAGQVAALLDVPPIRLLSG